MYREVKGRGQVVGDIKAIFANIENRWEQYTQNVLDHITSVHYIVKIDEKWTTIDYILRNCSILQEITFSVLKYLN